MKPCNQSSIKFSQLALAAIMLSCVVSISNALDLDGKSVPEQDIQMLPPVCKLILVEMPGIHQGQGNIYSKKYGYLLDRPEYRMAKNTPWLHHYCWALINKMRYFRANTDTERTFWFSTIMTNLDFVLARVPKDWPYSHILLLEQGFMMMLQNDYAGSLEKAKEALEHNPNEQRAYALEFDDYMAMKDKKKALDAAEEGLKKDPSSKILRKRLEQLGVALPPPSQTNQANQGTAGTTSSQGSASTHLDKGNAAVNAVHSGKHDNASEITDQPGPQKQEKTMPVEIKQ